jgi:hypothetical protein
MTSHRAVQFGIAGSLLIALFGLVARIQILVDGLARPLPTNIFFRLYALYEPPFLIIVALAAIVAALAMIRMTGPGRTSVDGGSWLDRRAAPRGRTVLLLAVVILAVTLLVSHFVLHGYAFSMDEFSADFQARLFAHGKYEAALPPFWRPFAFGLTPVFVDFDTASGSWHSVYLPIYSLLKTPFVMLGAGTLLNPLLAGLSILAIAAAARRLWPDEGLRPWLAVALLASSSEFIVTSGSQYSMPAHLLLNLVWLWLYLRGDDRSWLAALVVGGLALGLHNPFPHALFVAPFLIRLLRDRRWKRVGQAAVAYGIASILWFTWLHLSYSAGAGAGLSALFAVPTAMVLWLHAINVSLLFTWQAPLFGLLVIAALLQPRRLEPPLADLAWGVLFTLVFYSFFPSTQGHGWGYRYAYQVLGNLALLAAAGAGPLREALGRRRADLLLVASLVVAVALELPLRLVDTERFVSPFAAGAEYLQTRPADVVLVHGDSIWYGRDLVRNDPFLQGQPVILQASIVTPLGRSVIERAHPGRVIEVKDGELLRLGMTLSR